MGWGRGVGEKSDGEKSKGLLVYHRKIVFCSKLLSP